MTPDYTLLDKANRAQHAGDDRLAALFYAQFMASMPQAETCPECNSEIMDDRCSNMSCNQNIND